MSHFNTAAAIFQESYGEYVVNIECDVPNERMIIAELETGRVFISSEPLASVKVKRAGYSFTDLAKRGLGFNGVQTSPIYSCSLKRKEGQGHEYSLQLHIIEKANASTEQRSNLNSQLWPSCESS